MGEKRMYTCMCNWITMLYSRKKLYWGNNNKKNKEKNKVINQTVVYLYNGILDSKKEQKTDTYESINRSQE